jgi:hypothetical protein
MGENAEPRPYGRVLADCLPSRKFPRFSRETVAAATLSDVVVYCLFSVPVSSKRRECSPRSGPESSVQRLKPGRCNLGNR